MGDFEMKFEIRKVLNKSIKFIEVEYDTRKIDISSIKGEEARKKLEFVLRKYFDTRVHDGILSWLEFDKLHSIMGDKITTDKLQDKLQKLEEKRIINIYFEVLKSNNLTLQSKAIAALDKLNPTVVREVLKEKIFYYNCDYFEYCATIESMGKLGPIAAKIAVPMLIELLDKETLHAPVIELLDKETLQASELTYYRTDIINSATKALSEMGNMSIEAIPLLKKTARHINFHVSKDSREALKKIRDATY